MDPRSVATLRKPVSSDMAEWTLEALGVSAPAEKVYRAMLGHPGAGVSALARLCLLPEAEVASALDELAELSLLLPWQPGVGGPVPVSPEVGLGKLLSRQQHALAMRLQQVETCRAEVARIMADYADVAPSTPDPEVERLPQVEAVRDRLAELARSARYEIAALIPRTERTDDIGSACRQQDEAALRRGIRVRAVMLDSIRAHQPTLTYARWIRELGGEVRTTPELPLRMIMFDRRVALVPLIQEANRGDAALLLRGTGMASALCALFDSIWREARPLEQARRARDPQGLTDQQRVLLNLLGQGCTDEVIARRLAVSDRTVRRAVAEIMERLGARSRFQAGALAQAQNWLDLS